MMYFPLEKIGNAGGFGIVWKCMDENNNIFAMKQLKIKNMEAIERFGREVRLVQRLNHPNIIKIIDYNLECEPPFYVMPLYSNSLSEIIPNLRNDYKRQLTIFNSILSGVDYLHISGVFHRDLKPANILYNSDTDIVITDFGLSIQQGSDSTLLTRTNVGFGTERYCSPEQERDGHNVDERTDIYALGKILEDIVSNFNNYHDYDEGIKFIINKCTKIDREERFKNILELQRNVSDVYKLLLENNKPEMLEKELIDLAFNNLNENEVYSLALRVNSSNNMDYIRDFFSGISYEYYSYLEKKNEELMNKLINRICKYWHDEKWTFSYIDFIANVIKKIFDASQNIEIKAKLLDQLIRISINYNRYYAMDIAKYLLKEIMDNNGVQIALENLLRNNWINIEQLQLKLDETPSLILKLIEDKQNEEMHLY